MFRLFAPFSICNICRRSLWTTGYLLCDAEYHKVLGLAKGCNKKELKKRYVELSKQYHPDVVKAAGTLDIEEANRQFQQINEAYRMLMKKLSKPRRALVQTRGYQPRSVEAKRTSEQSESSVKGNESSKRVILDSHGWNLLVFMFMATLTIKLLIKEDGFMSSRRVVTGGTFDDPSKEMAAKKYSRDNFLYFLLGLPLLLLYLRYWNRYGR